MELKALVFAYCPTCRGITLVIDNYNALHKLGVGEVEQNCAFHSPTIKTVQFVCIKCKTNTAIAKLPMVYDVEGTVNMLNVVKKIIEQIQDQSVELTIWASMEGVKVHESFWERSKKVEADLYEMRQLLRAIEMYRFHPDTQQGYFKKGFWDSV